MTGRASIALALPVQKKDGHAIWKAGMTTVTAGPDMLRITRNPGPDLLHALFWLGIAPAAIVTGTAGPFLALLGTVPLLLLLPNLLGVLRAREIRMSAVSRQVDFIDYLGRRQHELALRFDAIRAIEVREVSDTDCPLFQVLLSCEGGASELTAGGIPDERLAVALGQAVSTFLAGAGVRHAIVRRTTGAASALHARSRSS